VRNNTIQPVIRSVYSTSSTRYNVGVAYTIKHSTKSVVCWHTKHNDMRCYTI